MTSPTAYKHPFWLRIYNMLAAITFNTLLLLLVALGIVWWVSPGPENRPTDHPLGINRTYSPYFRLHNYKLIRPETAQATTLEYDAWAADGHWQVHPWTGLVSRPFDGMYLNIEDNGVRQTRPPAPNHPNQRPLRVWVFGGSTTFGWGLGDDWTIPFQLQVALQASTDVYQVIVTNYAVPTYTSSQEVALFTAYLRLHEPPDAVVFVDGVNDVWYSVYEATQTPLVSPLSGVWEADIARLSGSARTPWITVNDTFPAAHWAQTTFGQTTDSPPIPYALQSVYEGDRNERLRKAMDSYRQNRRIATSLADTFNVLPLFAVQPWDDEHYPAFREGVLAGATPNTVDLDGVINTVDTPDNIYKVDEIHYSDLGSKVLAERLAEILIGRGLFE